MGNFVELAKDYQSEVPLLENLLKTMSKIQADQEEMRCQLNALIRFHNSCFKPTVALNEKFRTCKKTRSPKIMIRGRKSDRIPKG